jgi:hypothetical protein
MIDEEFRAFDYIGYEYFPRYFLIIINLILKIHNYLRLNSGLSEYFSRIKTLVMTIIKFIFTIDVTFE